MIREGSFPNHILNFLFGRHCALCDDVIPPVGDRLCPRCQKWMQGEDDLGSVRHMTCTGPNGISVSFPVYSAGRYRKQNRDSVIQYKFHARTDKLPFYKELFRQLLEKIRMDRRGVALPFDGIVPVPTSRRFRSGRIKFFHTEELAKLGCEITGLPYCEVLVKNPKKKKQLHTLGQNERREEASGSFYPAPAADIRGRRFLLCDDIVTTGATIKEAAETLYRAGAAEVTAYTLYQTLRPGRDNPADVSRTDFRLSDLQEITASVSVSYEEQAQYQGHRYRFRRRRLSRF